MVRSERKEREFNTRRAEILEQAEKIFAAKGFHDVTMAEIAGASGFSIGALYQFFKGKEHLYFNNDQRENRFDVRQDSSGSEIDKRSYR